VASSSKALSVRFFRTKSGREPVREWLKARSAADRKALGEEIRTVQPGWPLGMPVVRKLEPDLWEIRVRLTERTARILFTVLGEDIVLLHAFMKKAQRTPRDELSVARQRRNLVLGKS
jgi:phage-related protein